LFPASEVSAFASPVIVSMRSHTDRSMISAAQNRLNVTLMDWGGADAYLHKVIDPPRVMETFDDCTLIVYADGYDMLYTTPYDMMKRRILSIPDVKFSMSTECYCYPQVCMQSTPSSTAVDETHY
jgi:hypothetical protein